MRLFLTYLWVGGAVLYTLNTLAYTYLAEPVSGPTVSQPLKTDDAPPRRVASWGSHLPAGKRHNRPNEGSDSIDARHQPVGNVQVPRPLSSPPTTAAIEPKPTTEADELDWDAKVRTTETSETVARVSPDEDSETSSTPTHISESGELPPEDRGRNAVTTKAETAAPEAPARASASLQSALPQGSASERRQVSAPVVRTTPERRFPKLGKRRAERAGLGLFRFGPASF